VIEFLANLAKICHVHIKTWFTEIMFECTKIIIKRFFLLQVWIFKKQILQPQMYHISQIILIIMDCFYIFRLEGSVNARRTWRGGSVTPVNTCIIILTSVTRRAVQDVTVEMEPRSVIKTPASVRVKRTSMYVFKHVIFPKIQKPFGFLDFQFSLAQPQNSSDQWVFMKTDFFIL
jgi:hypothetical protein